jgi:hypothetical protein
MIPPRSGFLRPKDWGQGAMWQLTLDAWALKLAAEGEEAVERYNPQSRLQRHIVRIVRPSDGEKEAKRKMTDRELLEQIMKLLQTMDQHLTLIERNFDHINRNFEMIHQDAKLTQLRFDNIDLKVEFAP